MRVLIAGMTGQLGAGLVEAATQSNLELVPVVRSVGARTGSMRVQRLFSTARGLADRTLHGDVTEPMWGLSREDIELLRGRVDAVLNLAGETNWAAPASRLSAVNVAGALHGLDLANELTCDERAPLYCYASSIHAAGAIDGWVPEQPLAADSRRTPYEQSKWYAERLLLDRSRRYPGAVAIARVGGLVGNSTTGATAKRNSLYVLADNWRRLPLHVVPVARAGRVDMLPRNHAAGMLLRFVDALAKRPLGAAEIAHICAGETAPTTAALLAAVRSVDAWGEVDPPRAVPVHPRLLAWLSEHLDRAIEMSPARQNMLWGLRYLTFDRLFERSTLARLAPGALPSANVEQIARIVFGLRRAGAEAEDHRPLARFAG